MSNGPSVYQAILSQAIAGRLAHAYDRARRTFVATSRASRVCVRNTQRIGEYALEGREETPNAKARHP